MGVKRPPSTSQIDVIGTRCCYHARKISLASLFRGMVARPTVASGGRRRSPSRAKAPILGSARLVSGFRSPFPWQVSDEELSNDVHATGGRDGGTSRTDDANVYVLVVVWSRGPRLTGRGLRLSRRIVSAILFLADDCEACGGCVERIGFPSKSDGRHADSSLKMAFGTGAGEPKLLRRVLVLNRLPGGFPNQFERHSRRCRDGVNRRPTGLIHHRNILHFQGDLFSIRTDGQTRGRGWDHPIQP
jgi:hypothetical protein